MGTKTTQERLEKLVLHRDTIIEVANLKGAEIPINSDFPAIIAGIQRITLGLDTDTVETLLDDILGEVIEGDYTVKGQAIETSKEAIRQAIISKIIDIPEGTPLSQYSTKINEITTGGSSTIDNAIKATYIDFDGTILKVESGPSGFSPMPPTLPTGIGNLGVFSQWVGKTENLTEDAVIGALYVHNDQHSYFDLQVDAISGLTVVFKCTVVDSLYPFTIAWGDGANDTTSSTGNISLSHTYATYGLYRAQVRKSTTNTSNKLGYSYQGVFTPTSVLRKAHIGWPDWFSLYTFYNSRSLEAISLSNVTAGSSISYRLGGFYGCWSLKAVIVPAIYIFYPNISYNCFRQCHTLKYFLTADGNNGMHQSESQVFRECESLEHVKLPTDPSFTTLKENFFRTCRLLKEIELPANITTISQASSLFAESGLESIVIPESVSGALPSSMFNTCFSLKKIDIKSTTITAIGNYFIDFCFGLKTFIIRTVVPPTIDSTTGLGTTIYENAESSFAIYVPDSSVNAYKTASGWSKYANRIYPLSQYTE